MIRFVTVYILIFCFNSSDSESKVGITSNLLSQEDELYDIGDADIELGSALNILRKSASILGPLFIFILTLAPSIAFFIAQYIPSNPASQSNWIAEWLLQDTYYIVWIAISVLLITSRPSISPPGDFFNSLNIIIFPLPIFLNVYSEELFPDYIIAPFVNYMPVGSIALYWPSISLLRITSLNLFIFRYVLYQPIPEVGFSLYLQLKDFKIMIGAVIFCAITSLPIGYSLGAFPGIDNLLASTHNGAEQAVDSICLLLLFGLIFFLVSLPSELICHGVIQNLFHLQYLYICQTNAFISLKDYSNSLKSLYLYMGANEVVKNNFPFLWTVYLPSSDLQVDSAVESNSKSSNFRVGRLSFIRRNRILNTFPTWQDLYSEFWLVDGFTKYLRWFALPTLIDFGILVLASLIYTFILLFLILSPYADYMTSGGCNKLYFPFIAFPITYASGWTWRITNKVTASALVNAFIIWFLVVYGKISFN